MAVAVAGRAEAFREGLDLLAQEQEFVVQRAKSGVVRAASVCFAVLSAALALSCFVARAVAFFAVAGAHGS